MTFDHSQREAISCDTNVVVTAGAGSGKTTVLAERFVRLIRENRASVDQILTLTFTRKAAAEMYERIYRRLLAEPQSTQIQNALSHFETAQISTLDSFCSRVVRNDAGRFGLSTDFTVSEEETERTIAESTLEFILDHQDHTGVRALIAENGLTRTMADGLVPLGMEYFTVAETRDLEAMRERQEQALYRELSSAIETVRGVAAAVLELPASTATIRAAHEAAEEAQGLHEVASTGDYERVAAVAVRFGKCRKPGSNSKRQELLQLAELLEALRPTAAAVDELAATISVLDRASSIFDALEGYQEHIQKTKRATGRLSFNDVVSMAVVALAENPELRLHYKRQFRYIMIDEFQDNNDLQKRLLYLLAEHEGRSETGIPPAGELDRSKLYFVGDEKQSIYRFRGADVRVFKSLAAELGESGGRELSLSKNYRSHPKLVGFFNALFERLLGAPAADKEDYEADFSELEAGRSDPGTVAHVDILFKPFDPDAAGDLLTNDEAEAYAVAEYIERAVSTGSLRVGEAGRPARYEDFAILMRSGTSQATFERLLRRFGIPYNAGTVRSLFLEAPVNDMYNLLQLVAYPSDRLAYAALLRSPLVSLADDSMVSIMLADAAPFTAPEGVALATADREKLAHGAALYRDITSLADLVPPARLVSRIWYDWGYREVLLSNPRYHAYLEHYDYFHELALRYTGRPLVAFLDEIRPLLGSYERIPDLEVLGREETGVQILTIHKSKGLEFPVVIVANMGNVGRSDDGGSMPFYLSDEYGITINLSPSGSRDRANFFYRRGKEENDARELAETKRILYVAATRAESHLVFAGFHHYGNRNRSDAMLNLLFESLGIDPLSSVDNAATTLPREEVPPAPEGATVHRIENHPRSVLRGGPSAGRRRGLQDAAAAYRSSRIIARPAKRTEFSVTEVNAAYAASGRVTAGHRDSDDAQGLVGSIDDPAQALPSDQIVEDLQLHAFFGTLCHQAIEVLIRSRGEPLRQVDVRWPSTIPNDARSILHRDAVEMAFRVIQSDWWSELQEEHERIESEIEVLLRCPVADELCFLRGVIDVLATSSDRARVIDFKTDRLLDPAEYALQLSLYAHAVEGLSENAMPVSIELVHLRSGETRAVPPCATPIEEAGHAIRRLWEDR